MNLKHSIHMDNLIKYPMILLIVSFVVFSTEQYGRYVILICIIWILMADILKNKGVFRAYKHGVFLYLILVVSYTLFSCIWSVDLEKTLQVVKTLIEIMLMVFVVYNYYSHTHNPVGNLLCVIKLSSIIIVFYTLFYYGISEIIEISKKSDRLQNSFANVNTVGIWAAVGILIQINEFIVEKKVDWKLILCFPNLLIIAVTQSRKALFILIIGSMCLFILSLEKKFTLRKMLKSILIMISGMILGVIIINFPFMEGIKERTIDMISGLINIENADLSTTIRLNMIDIGISTFKESPIIGNGFGTSGFFLKNYYGDTYFHNNYVEILSGGGIVGLIIYYGIYVYLLYVFWKNRNRRSENTNICMVIMLVMLIMDYGLVTYRGKMNYIYITLYYLEVMSFKQRGIDVKRLY